MTNSFPDAKSMHATFEFLFNAGDLDGLVDLYEPNAVLNPSPEGPVQGRGAIRAALKGFLALGGKISITTKAVFEAPDGIALTQGDWKLQGGAAELAGKSSEVLRRQVDGRWLYIIDNPWA
jgi:ketosteroid isomerase-like protein